MSLFIAAMLLLAMACLGGHSIHRRLDSRAPWPEHLAWSWLIGQGLISAGAVLAIIAGRPLAAALCLPLAIAGAAFFLQLKNTSDTKPEPDRSPGVMLAPALASGLLAMAIVWRAPGLGFDGLAIWGHKARLLAETGRLSAADLMHPLSISMHPEYPLHVPLLGGVFGSLLAFLGGGWSDRILPLLAAADLTAISLLLASALDHGLRRATPPGSAADRRPSRWLPWLMVGGLLMPIVWRELPEGKADLTLALFLLAATVALSRWLRSGETGMLYLAAMAGGLGAFTKQEGAVWLAISFTLAWLLAPGHRRQLIVPALVALAIAAPWHFFRLGMGLRSEPFAFGIAQLGRLPIIVKTMGLEFLDLSHWGLLWLFTWPAVILVLAQAFSARNERASGASSFAALSLTCGAAAILTFFLATPHELEWHLSTALDRLFLPWWPVALLVLGIHITSTSSTKHQR